MSDTIKKVSKGKRDLSGTIVFILTLSNDKIVRLPIHSKHEETLDKSIGRKYDDVLSEILSVAN